MADEIAFNQHHALLIKKESVFGTAVTPTRDIGLIETFGIDDNNNTLPVEASGQRVAAELADGQYTAMLRCGMKYQHGRIFEYVFGGTTVHAETTSDWKHTFAVGTSLPSMTLGHSYNLSTDAVRTFNGVKVGNLTVEYALGQPIRIDWDGEAKSVDNSSTALTAVISSLKTLKSYHASLVYGTDDSESTVGKLESARFNFRNQLVRVDGAGSRESAGICADTLLIDFEFTMAFDDITEYEHFLGGTSPAAGDITEKSLVFNANNGVTLGSGREEINIDLSVTKLVAHTESKQLRGKVMQTFRGQATTINDVFTVDSVSSSNWD